MTDDLAALRLQLDWGVDEALADAPLNRLRAPAAPRPSRPAAAAVAAQPEPADAAPPGTLDEWFARLDRFDGCRLKLTATHTVRPAGQAGAAVMLVAEAPDADDDRSGQAFSGAAGALLRRVLAPAGLDPGAMLLATAVPWRPPGGRRPTEAEAAQCLPLLHDLVAVARPGRILALGTLAARALLGREANPRRTRGQWVQSQVHAGQVTIPVLQLPPLEQWLSSPSSRALLWKDLRSLQKALTNG